MPPRRPARAPQESNGRKFVKLVLLLAGAMAFKVALSNLFRNAGLIQPRSAVDDLAAVHAASATADDAVAKAGDDEPGLERDDAGTETPAQFVARQISDNRVVVFSKSYCPFSMRGKSIMRKHLGENGVAVVELETRPDMGELQDELQRITGGRTVPRIFVDRQFIGGADDVAAMDGSGQLGQMLLERGLISGEAAAAA